MLPRLDVVLDLDCIATLIGTCSRGSDELGAEDLDLLGGLRADVVCVHDCTEPLGGGYCLQARPRRLPESAPEPGAIVPAAVTIIGISFGAVLGGEQHGGIAGKVGL